MKKLFSVELYVKVLPNTFKISIVSEPSHEHIFTSPQPFTTQRLLVGEFSIADQCLTNAVKAIVGKSFFPKSVAIVVQPQAMVEGGLSQIEDRIFKELCLGAGAKKVVVWVGAALSARDVSRLLNTAQQG